MFDLTDDETYIDNILNGLQSKNDDKRYQALYTTDYIINECLDREILLEKIDKKLRDSMENEQRYNRIYRERLVNLIREKSGKEREIIYDQEKMFHQKIWNDPKYILQRCIFELYYPINDDPYKIVLNLLEENRGKTQEEEFYIFGSYIESMKLEELYSYDTFLKMDILKKFAKPENFSLIALEKFSGIGNFKDIKVGCRLWQPVSYFIKT